MPPTVQQGQRWTRLSSATAASGDQAQTDWRGACDASARFLTEPGRTSGGAKRRGQRAKGDALSAPAAPGPPEAPLLVAGVAPRGLCEGTAGACGPIARALVTGAPALLVPQPRPGAVARSGPVSAVPIPPFTEGTSA